MSDTLSVPAVMVEGGVACVRFVGYQAIQYADLLEVLRQYRDIRADAAHLVLCPGGAPFSDAAVTGLSQIKECARSRNGSLILCAPHTGTARSGP
jgi:hypothetical protein